jgi:hypothetical protein
MTTAVPFGNLIDRINNAGDDDFEDSFDETYGDPTNQPADVSNLTWGFVFIGAICVLLLVITMIGYGWIWYAKRMLKWCCPCLFRRRTAQEGDPQDSQGGSNNNNSVLYDTPTAANSSNNSVDNVSDSSAEEGELELQVVLNNSTYAKRLVRILTDEQKRSLFSSVLINRTATEADIMEGREEQQFHHPPVAVCGCTRDSEDDGNDDGNSNDENTGENSDENATTTTTTATSIVIPDGSPLATTTDATHGIGNNNACCPICIQDIEVGDTICHSKRKTCRHLFHLDCMLEWVGTGSTLCPVCRREIFTKFMLEIAYRDQQRQEQQQKQKKKAKKKKQVCP